MNRALYHKSTCDLGRYHSTINSLIISLFSDDRKKLFIEKQRLMKKIEQGGRYKEEATDILYMMCVDLLENKYLKKTLGKKEIRRELKDVELLAEMG